MFRSLEARNFRLFTGGHVVSQTGSWIDTAAQAWLVLELTESGTALGVLAASRFLPMLLLAPFAGVIADRMDMRRLMICTQIAMAGLAVTLWALVAAGLVTVVLMCLLAVLTGCAAAIDSPARQVIVLEMVGAHLVQNAMALNSMIVNLARMIGPSIAAGVISVVGIPACFAANALSYIVMVSVLLMLRADELQIGPRVERAPRQLRDGIRYLLTHRALFLPFVMVAVAGVFAWEFRITLPLVARFAFGGGPETLAILFASVGMGSLFGGLLVAAAPTSRLPALSRSGAVWGIAMLVSAFAPSTAVACAGLFVAGASSIAFNTFARTMLQLGSSPEMRGRVMALWAAAWVGSTALGGPLVGWIGQTFGARSSLVVGGVPLVLAAVLLSRRAGWRARDGDGDVHRPRSLRAPRRAPRGRTTSLRTGDYNSSRIGRAATVIRRWRRNASPRR